MAEKLEVFFNPSQLKELQSGNISNFINNIFSNQQYHIQMCFALREYHRNDGGSPEVNAFEVVNTSYNNENLTGRFRCQFRVNYHFTCSDVRNSAKDTIDWDFYIDQDHNRMLLTGEEVLER